MSGMIAFVVARIMIPAGIKELGGHVIPSITGMEILERNCRSHT
jgi:hypothetical protein